MKSRKKSGVVVVTKERTRRTRVVREEAPKALIEVLRSKNALTRVKRLRDTNKMSS